MAQEKLDVRLQLITGNYKQEAREAATATSQIGTAAQTGSKGLSGLNSAMGALKGALIAGGIAVAGRAVLKFGADAVRASSDLAESINAVNVTFGESSQKIIDWGETAAETAGLAKSEFNQTVVPMGSMLQNLGLNANQTADAVINMTQRAADMGSVLNKDTVPILEAMQSALAGQSEPMRRFGVDTSVAAIQQEALRMGLIGAGESMSQQVKAQATLSLIMSKTNKMAGDFANTLGESLPNQSKKMRAELENLKARIGERLTPAVLDVTKAFASMTQEGGLVEKALVGIASEVGDTASALAGVVGFIDEIILLFGGSAEATSEAREELSRYNSFLDLIAPGATRTIVGLDDMRDAMQQSREATEEAASWLEVHADNQSNLETRQGRGIITARELGSETGGLARAHRNAAKEAQNQYEATIRLLGVQARALDPFLNVIELLQSAQKAQENFTEAQKNSETTMEENARLALELEIANRELAAATRALGEGDIIAGVQTLQENLKLTDRAVLDLLKSWGLLSAIKPIETSVTIRTIEETIKAPISGTRIQVRQHGGSVFKGQPYLIGEGGPEAFIPSQSGSIASTRQLMAALKRPNSSRSTSFVFNQRGPDRPVDLQYLALLSNHMTLAS